MSGEPQTHVAHKSSKGKGFVATRAKQAAAFREGGAGAQRSGNTQKRAFGVANLGRAKRSVQRNADRGHRKEVVPLVQRARTEGAPPVVVVVCGPRGSGKSTLIRSLVKLYTRHNLASVDGPVTITVGKDKRLTLVECPDDLCGMIDLAKVADLVLLTIDASFGFEMVTFEFLAILQAHGFPKVMGVLTHLDKMKTNKALQHVKKALKHRFWADIYAGAKIFYIGGILQSGKYARNETRQLALYVSRVKFRPLTWRNAHGYVLCDRVDDATPPSRLLADPKCDRTVDCYGYVRGAHLKSETRVHVPGLGDFLPSELAPLDDPLPLGKAEATTADGRTKKLLKASETVIYAPMANVGNVDYEDGSVFIDLKTVAYSKDADVEGADDARRAQTGGAAQLVRRLQDLGDGVDGKLGDSTLRLFGSDAGVAASAVDDEDEEEDDDDMEEEEDDDDDESSDSEADGDAAARASFFERTKEDLSRRLAAKNAEDVAAWVYDSDASDGAASDDDDDDDDDAAAFFRRKGAGGAAPAGGGAAPRAGADGADVDDDGRKLAALVPSLKAGDLDGYFASTKLRFATGAAPGGVDGDGDAAWDDDAPLHGDFEELDASSSSDDGDAEAALSPQEAAREAAAEKKAAAMSLRDDDGDGGAGDDAAGDGDDDDEENTFLAEQRAALAKQKLSNEREFRDDAARLGLEGLSSGQYVRVRLERVPCEFVDHLSPRRPVILGGLLPHEAAPASLVTGRVRRHRWYGKVLKARDPVLFSCGWRRFQSAPLYSLEDERQTRSRYLKYTPEHMHCGATFWAPGIAPNSPLVGFHSLSSSSTTFRVSCVGVVLKQEATSKVSKKLKLCGAPYKVERNTAFVDGMFTSALEAAKFEGATLKTVSGVRGAIKKAVREDVSEAGKHARAGAFRASFEDKVLLSDIVVCRLWVPVDPPKLCAPVRDLLQAPGAPPRGLMRTVAELRRDTRTAIPVDKDSLYKPVDRAPRAFHKQVLPKKLVEALPFASKPKGATAPKSSKRPGYLASRGDARTGLAHPEAPEARAAKKLVHQLNALRNDKKRTRDATRDVAKQARAAKLAKIDASKAKSSKAKAKAEYKRQGKDSAKQRAKFGGD